MKSDRNVVLVTSVSRKVPLVQEIRQAFVKIGTQGKIIGGDAESHVVSRYFTDDFWEMPPLDMLSIDDFIYNCLLRQISLIIPTRDGELPYFAKHKSRLADAGISVMISPQNSVELCVDKLLFYEAFRDNPELGIIPTASEIVVLEAPSYVVKERYGAGTKGILINASRNQALSHSHSLKYPVFQPFIDGCEYSVDVYVTKQGKVKGVVGRSRDFVVNGESQVSTTLRHSELERATINLVEKIGIRGHAICQAIINNDGVHFIECNCRFGGASTLSVAAGLDSFYWFLTEAAGGSCDALPFLRSRKELRQVRYPADLIEAV